VCRLWLFLDLIWCVSYFWLFNPTWCNKMCWMFIPSSFALHVLFCWSSTHRGLNKPCVHFMWLCAFAFLMVVGVHNALISSTCTSPCWTWHTWCIFIEVFLFFHPLHVLHSLLAVDCSSAFSDFHSHIFSSSLLCIQIYLMSSPFLIIHFAICVSGLNDYISAWLFVASFCWAFLESIYQ
jgi:hypothetical protein